jgi:hypothetical protein
MGQGPTRRTFALLTTRACLTERICMAFASGAGTEAVLFSLVLRFGTINDRPVRRGTGIGFERYGQPFQAGEDGERSA